MTAAETVAAIIQTGTVPAAVEWLDHTGIVGLQQFTDTGYPTDAAAIVLIDIDGTAEQVDRDTEIVEQVLRRNAVEVRRADDDDARAKLWYGRLHAPDVVVRSGKGFFIGDVTVPRNRFPDMQDAIQAAAARHTDGLLFIMVAGHAGDGDLHPTTFFDRDNPKAAAALEAANNEIVDAALSMGGTITGEHGVGTEKRQFMTKRFTPVEIAAQRAIKRVFDPAALLQPRHHAARCITGRTQCRRLRNSRPYRARAAPNRICRPRDPRPAGQHHRRDTDRGQHRQPQPGRRVPRSPSPICPDACDHGVTCPAIPSEATQRTVGELIATASGAERSAVRHGLLGLEVVLPDGHAPARFGGENMKDVAGYDTKRLFIGSHNAFGTIHTVIFKIIVNK